MKRFLARWFGWLPGVSGTAGAPAPDRDPTGAPPRPPMAHAAPGATSTSPMLDCESAMRQLWDYLDGELTPDRMAAVRAHLELCKRCYPQLEFERSFLDAVANTAREHSDPERLRRRLIERLQAEGMTDA